MPTRSGAATQPGSSSFWWRVTLTALLVTGVLAMHVFAGGTHTGAGHTEMTHDDLSSVASAGPAGAENVDHSAAPSAGSTWDACCTTGICLSLVAGVILLLVASGVGRPLELRRRRAIGQALIDLVSRARFPDPPDLHSLSILRC